MAVELTREGGVAVVTVNRPEVLNAMNGEAKEQLLATVRGLAVDESVHVVVLTGGGEKSFVAGADIAEMKDLSPEQARASSALGQAVTDAIQGAPQPWIAAVGGFALGGGAELALACDLILASENAKFGLPEVNLGIFPGWGGTQRLPRVVGAGWAKYLALSGRYLSAEEARAIGLVQGVFPKEQLMAEVLKLAGELAAKSPLALRYCKAAVNAAANSDLATGQSIERGLFGLAFASADQSEGMAAFLEKRPPKYSGR
jgi:enoyl-CoA hydratase